MFIGIKRARSVLKPCAETTGFCFTLVLYHCANYYLLQKYKYFVKISFVVTIGDESIESIDDKLKKLKYSGQLLFIIRNEDMPLAVKTVVVSPEY